MYCGRFLWDNDVCCSENKMLVNEVTGLNCNVRELNFNLKTLLEVAIKKPSASPHGRSSSETEPQRF